MINKQTLWNKKIGDIPVIQTLLIIAVVVAFPLVFSSRYTIRIAGGAGIWVMLALGLNVVCGFAGLLDLGYVVPWGIGGYICALLSSGHLNIHLPFLAVVPLSILGACLFGLFIGSATLRLRGDYLGIVTLASMQIFRILLLNLDRPINLTGGPNGIVDIDYPRILGFTLKSASSGYYLIWVFVLFTILASFRLKSSRLGRAWEAIREDELASNAMGINTFWLKILAFITGAGFAGAAGALFAEYTGGVYPSNYDFAALNTIYCMLIIGGLGNVRGVVLGALTLAVIPELLREYGDWRMIGYGLLLVIIVIVRPNGLLGEINLSKFRGKKARTDRSGGGETKASPRGDKTLGPEIFGAVEKLTIDRAKVLLDVQKVRMDFGGLVAVHDFSLTVHEGEIVSIIGPNGAGKTTIFNMITGIYAPTAGKIFFGGKDVTGLRPYQLVKHGIARTFQNIRLYDKMSVLDNVKTARYCRTKTSLFGILFRLPSVVRTEEQIEKSAQSHLSIFGDRFDAVQGSKAVDLSYASRRRLEIARALCTSPRMILLDEPSAGMNPQETAEIGDFIKHLRDDYGYTFLLIEHKLEFVKNLSDKVIAMDYGKKITEGDYISVANNEQVIEAYLGRKKTNG